VAVIERIEDVVELDAPDVVRRAFGVDDDGAAKVSRGWGSALIVDPPSGNPSSGKSKSSNPSSSMSSIDVVASVGACGFSWSLCICRSGEPVNRPPEPVPNEGREELARDEVDELGDDPGNDLSGDRSNDGSSVQSSAGAANAPGGGMGMAGGAAWTSTTATATATVSTVDAVAKEQEGGGNVSNKCDTGYVFGRWSGDEG